MRHCIRLLLACGVFALALDGVPAKAQTVRQVPAGRTYINAHVYEEAGQLHFNHAGRKTVAPTGGWRAFGQPAGELVALVRRSDTGTDLRVLNADGQEVGTVTLPRGRVPLLSGQGVFTVVESLHGPVVPHEIGFYALNGTQLRMVSEPGLGLVISTSLRDGRLVTVNMGPADDDRSVIVYSADGTVLWRYDWKGQDLPDVVATRDNQRLVLVHRDFVAWTSTVTVLGPGNQVVQTHTLPLINRAIASDDSQRVAVVGQSVVAMIDAPSGRLDWRKDEDIDFVLYGGLRFDPTSGRLLVVTMQRDRGKGESRMRLRSFDPSTGAMARAELGTWPLDYVSTVLTVDMAPTGQRRVLLYDRTIETAPEQ